MYAELTWVVKKSLKKLFYNTSLSLRILELQYICTGIATTEIAVSHHDLVSNGFPFNSNKS